jgi:hypothetical protein
MVNLKEIGHNGVNWINLDQDKYWRQAPPVNMVMILQLHKRWSISRPAESLLFLKKDFAP